MGNSESESLKEENKRLREKLAEKEANWTIWIEDARANEKQLLDTLQEEKQRHTETLKTLREMYQEEKRERERQFEFELRMSEKMQEEEKFRREAELRKKIEDMQDSFRRKEEQLEAKRQAEMQSLQAKYEQEEKLREEARREEEKKLEEARRRNDEEMAQKHQQKLNEMTAVSQEQLKAAHDSKLAAEKERVLAENERIKTQQMLEEQIREKMRREEEEREKRAEEERRKAEEIHNEKIRAAKEKVLAAEKKAKQDIQQLRDEINKLHPGASFDFPPDNITFPGKYNVGLFGTTGIGKSSLLNSLKFAMKGKLDELSMEHTSTKLFHGGNTVRRLDVQVTPHLVFIDNRGIGAEDLERIDAAKVITSQLEGKAGFARKVDWQQGAQEINETSKKENRIHCTILVFDACNPRAIYSVLPKLVRTIHDWQGSYPVSVLTHVDVATKEQLENMYVVLRTAGILDIYEIANITRDKHELELEYQLSLLKLMKRCVKYGDNLFKLREEIERDEIRNRDMKGDSMKKREKDGKQQEGKKEGSNERQEGARRTDKKQQVIVRPTQLAEGSRKNEREKVKKGDGKNVLKIVEQIEKKKK